MAAHCMTTLFGTPHVHLKEIEPTANPMTAHITPQYHIWSKSHHTVGDFTDLEQPNGMKSRFEFLTENTQHPCTQDEFLDAQCRTNPANKFAAKMTIKRPGEYCDAWTLPRLEACRKAFGVEA